MIKPWVLVVAIAPPSFLAACGVELTGTGGLAYDSSGSDADQGSRGDATSIEAQAVDGRDGTAPLDASIDRNADVMADAKGDADASCRSIGSTCGAPGECCSLACEDEDGTLRCQ